MKNTQRYSIALLTAGSLMITLLGCTVTADKGQTEVTETMLEINKKAPTEKTNKAQNSTGNSINISQEFRLTHYYNDNWQIAIVEALGRLNYYGCNLSTGLCQTLSDGMKKCVADDCSMDWTADDGVLFSLAIATKNQRLMVRQGKELLVDSGLLNVEATDTQPLSNISPEQEYVAGVTGEQLAVLIPQVRKAVFNRDWQTIAELSGATVNVNYGEGARSTRVMNGDLAQTLAAENLDQWTARVLSMPLNDVFLNQYGAMIGAGAIWINTGVDEATPKIYSINIF